MRTHKSAPPPSSFVDFVEMPSDGTNTNYLVTERPEDDSLSPVVIGFISRNPFRHWYGSLNMDTSHSVAFDAGSTETLGDLKAEMLEYVDNWHNGDFAY